MSPSELAKQKKLLEELVQAVLAVPRKLPLLQGTGSGETAVFVGNVDLPLGMEASEGVVLEKGNYNVEIRIDTEQRLLLFFKNGKRAAVVKGQTAGNEPYRPGATPVCGTVYLHAADVPIGTEEERR